MTGFLRVEEDGILYVALQHKGSVEDSWCIEENNLLLVLSQDGSGIGSRGVWLHGLRTDEMSHELIDQGTLATVGRPKY